jgi:aminoglycoside phosphotransferase (APT) family kinase protein
MASPAIAMVKAISRSHLIPDADGELTVSFLAEGVFNKIYTVDVKTTLFVKSYIFWASLPVEPVDKIQNEVAILDYIKQRTSIPVPIVIAHGTSSGSELEFEWIIMEKVPGTPLRDI